MTEAAEKKGKKEQLLKKEDGKSNCKICKKSFPTKSLLRHIGQTTTCKKGYGKEFDELKSANRKKAMLNITKRMQLLSTKTKKIMT